MTALWIALCVAVGLLVGAITSIVGLLNRIRVLKAHVENANEQTASAQQSLEFRNNLYGDVREHLEKKNAQLDAIYATFQARTDQASRVAARDARSDLWSKLMNKLEEEE